MIVLLDIIRFFKKQWFSVLIILVLILIQYKSQEELISHKEQIKELRQKIDKHKTKGVEIQLKIDSLSNVDQEVITKIKTIKQKEYVQIKVVDSLPVSKLQQFFTDKYPKE